MPATATKDDVLELDPDGVFLSNGPGDPAATATYAVPVIRRLIEAGKPVFGICLGHQLMATALGGTTHKLPFGHHGGNHPVRHVHTGAVEITSQNHNFAVAEGAIPGAEITHVNLNDGVVEGIAQYGNGRLTVDVAAIERNAVIARWAATQSPRNAVFAVPPSWSGFRSEAHRAIVVDFKAFPFQETPIYTWFERLMDLAEIAVLRQSAPRRISWTVLFMKAYASVAAACPQPIANEAIQRRAGYLNERRQDLYDLSLYLVLLYEAPHVTRKSTELRGVWRAPGEAFRAWLRAAAISPSRSACRA